MYEVKNDLFCQIEVNPHNIRIQNDFEVSFARTVYHGNGSISYLCPTIRDILPASIKEANSLNSFAKLLKKWVPLTYVPVDCVRAAYLELVLWKTYYNKCILLLLILMIYSYTEWAKWARNRFV